MLQLLLIIDYLVLVTLGIRLNLILSFEWYESPTQTDESHCSGKSVRLSGPIGRVRLRCEALQHVKAEGFS